MLKPEQIANAKFTPVSTGTYSADEVDAFLAAVANAYGDLLNDKATLMKKISFLAEKVEGYRNDEEALKAALLDAHKMAEAVGKNAAEKAAGVLSDADTRAKKLSSEAERQAAECTNAARNQAAGIVTNARNAVASIKDRAQQEAENTVSQAKNRANTIITTASDQGEAIIGSSKKQYDFYTAELAKVRAELDKFKTMVEMLCNGQMKPEDVPAAVAEPIIPDFSAVIENAPIVSAAAVTAVEVTDDETAEPAYEDEGAAEAEPVAVSEPEPEIASEPVIAAEPIPERAQTQEPSADNKPSEAASIDDDDELDDLYSLFDEGEDAPAVDFAANIDDLLPDNNEADISSRQFDPKAAPEVKIVDEKAEVNTDIDVDLLSKPLTADSDDDDDFLKDLDVDLEGMDDLDLNDSKGSSNSDDDDISSLFDSLFD